MYPYAYKRMDLWVDGCLHECMYVRIYTGLNFISFNYHSFPKILKSAIASVAFKKST